MALYELSDEQIQFLQDCIEHQYPLSSDDPEADTADVIATILQQPRTTMYYVIWNGTMVYTDTDEVKYHQYLTETIGMTDQFITDHMNGGSYNITFSDDPADQEDDSECVSGWNWSPDRGDDYIELEIGSSDIGKE